MSNTLLTLAQTDAKNRYGFYLQPELSRVFLHEGRQEKIQMKMGFSAGFNYNRKISKNVLFRTGIGYGFKHLVHNETGLVFGSDINNGTTSRLESNVKFHELHLPVFFQFRIYKPLHINIGFELSKSFKDNSTQTIFYGNGQTESLSITNVLVFNCSPMLSIVYELPLQNQKTISIEPFYKLYLRPYLFNDIGMYSFGLRMSYNLAK